MRAQDLISDPMMGDQREVTSMSFLFASKICDLFACNSFVMARRASLRSEAGRSCDASNASFAARAIDSVSPMALRRPMTPLERWGGIRGGKMSSRGKNATLTPAG